MAVKPLSPKQARSYHEATARVNLWHGAVRSGKTVASHLKWIERCLHGPAGDLLMVGKTERTLRRNVLMPLQEILGPQRMRITTGSGEAEILGRRVYLVGANDERAEQKIRGLTLAGANGDEVSLWPESFFAMLLSRLSVPGAQLFGTTNPDAPLHWLKASYIDRAAELDLRSWHFKLEDNPYLDPQYVASLKREYTGLWYRRFIDGAWVQAEGAIWDAFNPDRHVLRELPGGVTFDRYAIGIDYGTSNPFVALYAGRSSDAWYVLDRWRHDSRKAGRQLSDAQYLDRLGEWIGQREVGRWWVDPSATSFIVAARQRGYPVGAAENSVEDGLREVATLLAQDRLYFVEADARVKAEPTVAEVLGYVWDPKKQAKGEDAPLKQQDHGPDALRYLIASERRGHRLVEYGWVA